MQSHILWELQHDEVLQKLWQLPRQYVENTNEWRNSNEKYIQFREYPNEDEDASTVTKLMRPTINFKNVIKAQLMAFNRTWQKHWAFINIRKNIVTECVNAKKNSSWIWFDIIHKCYNHQMYALKYDYYKIVLSYTRYNNCVEKRCNTRNRKMKNIWNK